MAGTKQAMDKEALKLTKKCKWRLFVSNGFRADGKQNRATKVIGPCSTAQADKELQKFYLEFTKKPPNSSSRITFSEFVDIWLERHVKLLSPNTLHSHQGHIDARIKPYFGHMRLNKITSEHLITFFDDLKTNGDRLDGREGKINPGCVFDYYRVTRAVFNKAVEWGYISASPCDGIPKDKKPKPNYKVKPILEEEELAILLTKLFELKENYTNMKNQLFFYLSLIDGCRSGEHIALTWQDINFQAKKITISKDVYEEAGHTYIKNSTKGGAERIVYCDDLCIELLKKFKLLQEAYFKRNGCSNPHNFIFVKRMRADDGRVIGEPAGRSAFYHWITAFLKKNGLPHVDVHTFRRMAASYSVNNQVPLTTVQQMLGHKSLSTTMIYLRSLLNNRLDGVNTLSNTYQQLMSDTSSGSNLEGNK